MKFSSTKRPRAVSPRGTITQRPLWLLMGLPCPSSERPARERHHETQRWSDWIQKIAQERRQQFDRSIENLRRLWHPPPSAPGQTPLNGLFLALPRSLDSIFASMTASWKQGREEKHRARPKSHHRSVESVADRWNLVSVKKRIDTGSLQLQSYLKSLKIAIGRSFMPVQQSGSGSGSPEEWCRTKEWISVALALGAAALLLRWAYLGVHRYATADHLPAHYLALPNPQTGQPGVGRRLSGLVVHVGDGDNFRVLHTPWLLRWWIRWRWQVTGGQLPGKGTLASQTIHVRLAGIDAPECAHFGMLGQRYGPEAKAWLQRTLLNQPVRLELYQRDRFGRVVAHVWRPLRIPLFGALLPGRNVSLEMVRAGYAEVYRGTGAVYGHFQKALEAAEQKAIRRRLGMWASTSAPRFRNAGNASPASSTSPTRSLWQRWLAGVRRPSEYKRLERAGSARLDVAAQSRVPVAAAPSKNSVRRIMVPEATANPSLRQTLLRPRLLLRALSSSIQRRSKKRSHFSYWP